MIALFMLHNHKNREQEQEQQQENISQTSDKTNKITKEKEKQTI